MADVIKVDREEIFTNVQKVCGDLEKSSRLHAFKLAPVKSYVGNMKTLGTGGFPGVVVPSFATHWAVVIDVTMYHLTFRDPGHAAIELGDMARYGKPVKFTSISYDRGTFDDCPVIGYTMYSHEDRVFIGQALLEMFGNYHRLFWNCQVYAECFLRLITGGSSFVKYWSAFGFKLTV